MKRKTLPALIIAFTVALVAIGAYALGNRDETKPKNSYNTVQSSEQPTDGSDDEISELASKAAIVKADKAVKFATQTLRVNSAKSTNLLASQYVEPVTASPGAVFIIINITVTNDSDTPFIFRDFKLFDNKNRMYDSSSDAYVLDDAMDGRKLGPGVAETGSVVYEVPKQAAGLKVGGPNADTGKFYLITLPL